MDFKQHQTKPSDHISFKQLAAFGFGGFIPIALFNCVGQLTQLMGNISLGISAFAMGCIMIFPRLWDAVSDPFVGHWSDNCRSRWGRRRPFILVGGIGVALSFAALWWVPQGDNINQYYQMACVLLGLLLFYTCCTVFEIPHGALGMEMSTDPHERTRLFSAKSFLGNLAAMGTPWLFALANMDIFKGATGNEMDGMRMVSLIITAVLIPMAIWWFFSLKEPSFEVIQKQEKTPFWQDMKQTASNKTFLSLTVIIFTLAMGFNFVGIFGYYISIYYLYGGDKVAAGPLLGVGGTVWAITGLLAVFPLNWISIRLGKKATLTIAIGLMCLAQITKIVCYNPDFPYLILIPTVLLSAGMLFFFTLGSSMVGDVCDEDDLNTGTRSEGSYYSVFWWFIKMGTAFASFVTGLLIVFTQFDEVQIKRSDALMGAIKELHASATTWSEQKDIDKELIKIQLEQAIQKALSETKKVQTYFTSQLDNSPDRKEHILSLIETNTLITTELTQIKNQLNELSLKPKLLLEKLTHTRSSFSQLSQQAPYTLFWMRAVEIGLPLLLSLISIFFIRRYSLSEERSYEIKEALKKRNELR